MPTPFGKDFKPTERAASDPSERLYLQFPDDWFNIKVTEVGDIFEKTNSDDKGNRSTSETFVVTGDVIDHNLTPWHKKGERTEYQPPAKGEKGIYFHPVTKTQHVPGKEDKTRQEWKDQNFQAALTAAGVSSLVEGDELGVLFHRIEGRSHVYEYVVKPTGKRDKPVFPKG